MEEINFIRPEEVYNRNTGESKVRYRSYDGNDRFIPVVEGEDGVPKTLIEVTWQELKNKRDASKLTPGALYRITDYQCTTTQADTRSAGHQFDIVLLALSENKLAEEGWAMMHENDTYFANSNLSAWKVWYSLDNDKSRFAWADNVNGKGVIYRLIDEFNNDIKYDFKNIQFKRKLTNGQYNVNGTETWCYTLNLWYNDMCQDASIVGNTLPNDDDYISGVYDNKFGYATAYDLYLERVSTFTFALGNNVILSFVESGAYFGIYSNTIGTAFCNNTIGAEFYSNTIGNGFIGNTIGNSFNNNMIGNVFTYKTISDNTTYKNYGNNGVELATKS